MLRQGPGRDPDRDGDRLATSPDPGRTRGPPNAAACPTPNPLRSHEAGPEAGRLRVTRAARRRPPMPTTLHGGGTVGVIIIREMVGTSPRSWSDAARQAVATASKTVRNIQTVEVVKSTAVVENGEIVEYRVELKIGFEYEG